MMRILILCFGLLFSVLAHAGQTLVLVSDPWCPVACATTDPRPGYMVELAKAVFEPAGYQVDYQVVPFARAEAMVNSGEANAFLGVLKLAKRQNWVFPTAPQAVSRVCFYTRPESAWAFTDEQSLRQIRLGTIRGYSYGAQLDAKLGVSKIDEVSGVGGFARSVAKLKAGRVDAIVEYELIAQYQLHQTAVQLRNAGCAQASDDLYIGFSPKRADSANLAKLLEDGIKKMRKSGELQKILKLYGISDWVVAK